MRVDLRSFTAADQPALEVLWVAAWRQAMPRIDFEARRGWLKSRFAELLDAGADVIVATSASEPVGFVTVDPTGYVDQLAVAPAYQNGGLATRLLEAARARCDIPLRLSVNLDNVRALSFYQARGFRQTGLGVNPSSGLVVVEMAETREP